MNKTIKNIYLDYASATPVDTKVKKAMLPFLSDNFGNPSSLHLQGVKAREAVENSRKAIAQIINSHQEEIVFTSGGTESCNLAILDLARSRGKGHIITSSIEHHAVHEPIKEIQRQGFKVTFLPVNKEGFVNLSDIEKAIRKDTKLVSIMYANNEIGTIQSIFEIGKLLHQINNSRIKNKLPRVLFHTDACQAVGYLDINVNRLGVDLMSASGSKIYGPKGVGFLYVKKGTDLNPIIFGGGQERGLRSGTENVAGIVGFAKAMELVNKNKQKENSRLTSLRNYCIKQVKKAFSSAQLNGPDITFKDQKSIKSVMNLNRLPNNINFTFPGMEGETLMLYLDAKNICVSTASACSTGNINPSHVLKAVGLSDKQAKESIRITIGKYTNKKELDLLIKYLKDLALLIYNER